ncbi:MAG: hypothetical protein LBL93_07700 [Ruminococcus sp.]|jgi:hypothetical protein|nr:hypothetical protein [Ruminococcus sp.]
MVKKIISLILITGLIASLSACASTQTFGGVVENISGGTVYKPKQHTVPTIDENAPEPMGVNYSDTSGRFELQMPAVGWGSTAIDNGTRFVPSDYTVDTMSSIVFTETALKGNLNEESIRASIEEQCSGAEFDLNYIGFSNITVSNSPAYRSDYEVTVDGIRTRQIQVIMNKGDKTYYFTFCDGTADFKYISNFEQSILTIKL